jgi:hypothetical protein
MSPLEGLLASAILVAAALWVRLLKRRHKREVLEQALKDWVKDQCRPR